MVGRSLEQQQVQEESLVAVLIIENSDRKEKWMNCGPLIYDLRTLDNRPKSRPPLIGTTVVLGRYEGVFLNGIGMRMEMMGPGDIIRLRETCEGIVTENNADSDAGGDLVDQIHETFLNNEISDVCVM